MLLLHKKLFRGQGRLVLIASKMTLAFGTIFCEPQWLIDSMNFQIRFAVTSSQSFEVIGIPYGIIR